MPSVLMTSTMKSDPGLPPMRFVVSRGVSVSAAATCSVGLSAEGTRGAGAGSAARATGVLIAAAAGAGPAAAGPPPEFRIGRGARGGRGEVSVGGGSLKKKKYVV